MAVPKVYVDGRLITWSDTLFSPPYRPAKGVASKPVSWRLFPTGQAAAQARAQIERTAKKAPEVMVKITNKKGAGRGMANIRNHLDYISRNGKLEIEDQRGELVRGRSDLKDFQDNWQISSGRTIAEEEGKVRDALNIVFSMSPGTPADKVKDAVRDFLGDEFDGREYVFVLHTDTQHPHVHVCVKTAPAPGLKRLSPRKNDLQRWREGFAQKLRDNGIEANATPRRTRGVTRQPLRQIDIHRAKRQQALLVQKDIDLNQHPKFGQRERHAWKEITKALNSSDQRSDIHLAKKVMDFWQQSPIGQAVKKSLTERKNHVREQLIRGWRAAATRLHQPDHYQAQTRIQSQVQPVPGMWPLPSGAVASEQGKSTALLLYPDALNYLGRRTSPDIGMRRPDIRAPGAARGGIETPLPPSSTDTDRKR